MTLLKKLTLLVVLASALGVFAATPRSTTAQSQPLETCSVATVQSAFRQTPAYQPTSLQGWVEAGPEFLTLNGAPFLVQGINYYPSRSPWRRFLTDTSMSVVDRELDLIALAGFNTIRLYLWNDALFQCFGSGAVPQPQAFAILDGVIQRAAVRGLRVILTLNDMPDLENYPLYSNPAHTAAQTSFLVSRYAQEPAVMAWDMRNAGDIDYGIENNLDGEFSREQVVNWLADTSALIRELDGRHLLTAGWAYDSAATIPYVDFISFAHWSDDLNVLRGRLISLSNATTKPVVLTSFGYSTFEQSEEQQRDLIDGAVGVIEEYDAGGWVLWTGFDFPLDATCVEPNCPSQDNREHHFGLWRTDYTAKPALEAIAAG
jgi:hypothetical protein